LEQNRWAQLYYYLVAASILILSWSTLFSISTTSRSIIIWSVLYVLATAGVAVSVMWILQMRRSNRYLEAFFDRAYALESELFLRREGPLTTIRHLRHNSSFLDRLGKSYRVVIATPTIFLAVNLLLVGLTVIDELFKLCGF
jgi:hypothetical protein